MNKLAAICLFFALASLAVGQTSSTPATSPASASPAASPAPSPVPSPGAQSGTGGQANAAKQEAAKVHIDFDEPPQEKTDKDSDEFLYAPPIEQLLRDPAIAANIANGAESLNKSVESLMDAVFYSVLTNEKNFYFNPTVWINAILRRTVFSAPSGAYVIVDRFLLGPRYDKVLWTVDNVPVSLGIDASAEAVQIYLRSDGMRLTEQDTLPPWRRQVNNWFGLVPFLGSILPPSFNQNYLYDPVTELKTPFVFPFDIPDFETMPIGSIRSYAISGGIRLSPDFAGLLDQDAQAWLQRVGGVQAGIPYAVFKRGEHRINVLRRGPNSAWVGVSDLNRTGHGINPLIGQQYFLLTGALAATVFKYHWAWKGVPISLLPISYNLERAMAAVFDQVYEFDLTKPAAVEAYKAAVRGDFVPAHGRYLDAKQKHMDTGVSFGFARNQDRTEDIERSGPNIGIYRRERERDHNEAEIEITDEDGKFFVLESQLNVDDKRWNILVGEDEDRYQQTVEMHVKRTSNALKPDDRSEYTYTFEPGPDPYRLTMALNIQDRYVDVVQYERYIAQLRSFTDLPLADVPVISTRDPVRELAWRRRGYFTPPGKTVSLIHVVPLYLGKFGAQASVSFSAEQVAHIVSASENKMWASYAKAYGFDPLLWGRPEFRASLPFQAQWFEAFFAYPLNLFNIHVPQADAIHEATQGVRELIKLKDLATPLDKLHGFYHLLDTDHPRELARALLDLADEVEVPRRVTFSAQPGGGGGAEDLKKSYGTLNNRTFHAGPPFPAPSRYMHAKATLAKFSLDQPHMADHRPRLAKIQITTHELPASLRSLEVSPDEPEDETKVANGRQVFLTFNVHDVMPGVPLKLYVKVEQTGRIQLGKLDLVEKVIELTPVNEKPEPDNTLTYECYLTGPLSPLTNYLMDQSAKAGDELQLTLAVSRDGAVWSDLRTAQFRFEDGRLYPAEAP